MRVLGISGSLRRGSHNTEAASGGGGAAAARSGARPVRRAEDDPAVRRGRRGCAGRCGQELARGDRRRRRAPVRDARVQLVDSGAAEERRSTGLRGPRLRAALRNKPAAVIGASTGMFGAVWAQAELRKVLGAAGARVIDRELPVGSAAEAFNADGTLVERDQALELDAILVDLLAEAQRVSDPDRRAGAAGAGGRGQSDTVGKAPQYFTMPTRRDPPFERVRFRRAGAATRIGTPHRAARS